MDAAAGAIRNSNYIKDQIIFAETLLKDFSQKVQIADFNELSSVFRLRDLLIEQRMYLYAMSHYIQQGGHSRGSAIYTNAAENVSDGLGDLFSFTIDDGDMNNLVQLTAWKSDGPCRCEFREVRPLPEGGGVFETVWRRYREDKNIY